MSPPPASAMPSPSRLMPVNQSPFLSANLTTVLTNGTPSASLAIGTVSVNTWAGVVPRRSATT